MMTVMVEAVDGTLAEGNVLNAAAEPTESPRHFFRASE